MQSWLRPLGLTRRRMNPSCECQLMAVRLRPPPEAMPTCAYQMRTLPFHQHQIKITTNNWSMSWLCHRQSKELLSTNRESHRNKHNQSSVASYLTAQAGSPKEPSLRAMAALWISNLLELSRGAAYIWIKINLTVWLSRINSKPMLVVRTMQSCWISREWASAASLSGRQTWVPHLSNTPCCTTTQTWSFHRPSCNQTCTWKKTWRWVIQIRWLQPLVYIAAAKTVNSLFTR